MVDRYTKRKPSKLVAVVVPMSMRKELTQEEKISLRHLEHYLGNYDKFMVVPKSLKVQYNGFGLKPFDDKFFGSAEAHKRLILSSSLYEAFADYQYILFYHLDALVFSDQLIEWCKSGYDYIGAPWIEHEEAPYAHLKYYNGKVGNGGFTLKKIDSMLKVLNSKQYHTDPCEYWSINYGEKPMPIRMLNIYKKLLKTLGVRNNVRWEIRQRWMRQRVSVELFWADRAKHYYPKFRIPPVETAVKFAFECVPRYCYEVNGNKLPFGCHAWQRYDPAFWEPYLLT
ncbi:MAG: hypothetical protein HGJ97_18375 [Desulfosporosinus sp.]|nr:hypothetical protein [Desulfosporosinus sp.]